MSRQPGNFFLRSLTTEDRCLLASHLQDIELPAGKTLHDRHDPIAHIYFPRSGIISLVIPFSDGRMGEFGMLGWNTLVGGIAALRATEALNTAVIQVSSQADRISTRELKLAIEASRTLRDCVRAHEQALAAQTFQIAACNAVHTLPERLSRWLLQCRDLLGTDDLPLTHEFIAMMLGVRRPSVTMAIGEQQKAGLLRSHRGQLEILDVEALRRASCECYDAIVREVRHLTGWGPDADVDA